MMANILLLVHRLPYPPNKGDKVRSYHLLKHLAMQHQIFLGTFVDDPFDMEHVDTVRSFCRELHVAQLDPKVAKIRSLTALATSDPLSLNYYRDDALQDWVDQLCSQQKIDAVVVFSSPMAQYIESMPQLPVIIDFVDVDSAKWTQYAPNHHWPMSWLYRREGRTLLNYERKIAALSVRSFLSPMPKLPSSPNWRLNVPIVSTLSATVSMPTIFLPTQGDRHPTRRMKSQ